MNPVNASRESDKDPGKFLVVPGHRQRVAKAGLILTRNAGQISVRVTRSSRSEEAGQPAGGFVATSPATLHDVAANCGGLPTTTTSGRGCVLGRGPHSNSGKTRVATATFTR